jgi:hypothetical protein
MFCRVDSNKSGTITPAELQAALRQAFQTKLWAVFKPKPNKYLPNQTSRSIFQPKPQQLISKPNFG